MKATGIVRRVDELGRVVLPPSIFPILRSTPVGYGGELQLTDAMKTLARNETMIARIFAGERNSV